MNPDEHRIACFHFWKQEKCCEHKSSHLENAFRENRLAVLVMRFLSMFVFHWKLPASKNFHVHRKNEKSFIDFSCFGIFIKLTCTSVFHTPFHENAQRQIFVKGLGCNPQCIGRVAIMLFYQPCWTQRNPVHEIIARNDFFF